MTNTSETQEQFIARMGEEGERNTPQPVRDVRCEPPIVLMDGGESGEATAQEDAFIDGVQFGAREQHTVDMAIEADGMFYAKYAGWNELFSDMGHTCPYEYCIESQEVEPDTNQCPMFGHRCPSNCDPASCVFLKGTEYEDIEDVNEGDE